MATRDEAHGKRCASVRFPVLASQPVSKARKAKAHPKGGRPREVWSRS